MNSKRRKTLEMIVESFSGKSIVTTAEFNSVVDKLKASGQLPMKTVRWIKKDYRHSHGHIELPSIESLDEAPTVSAKKVKGEVPESVTKETESLIDDVISFIPEVDPHFVRWGNCKDVE